MATKKRAIVSDPPPRPHDTAPTEDDLDAESVHDAEMNSDVEQGDSTAPPASDSVEALAPATGRVDIEHGVGRDEGDIERGDAGAAGEVEPGPD